MTHCVHHIPGRARFKVPQLQTDPNLALAFDENIRALDGIRRVEINRTASSIVIHYDTSTSSLDVITAHIRAQTPVTLAEGVDNPRMVKPHNGKGLAADGRLIRTMGQIFGQAIFTTIVKRALERSLLSLLAGVH